MSFSFIGFKRYKKKPNTISYGTLFTKDINIPFAAEKTRTLRVWLPEDYDNKKRFPVFYFTDGQNMVDAYTSGFGEWEMDEKIHEYIQSGHQGIILVGIDCTHNGLTREAEYRPNIGKKPFFLNIKREVDDYAEKFAEYIINNIKPLIDQTFLTKSEREYTGFGGSSMGGLFSFYITSKYSNTFSMSLSYSPAFFFYTKSSMEKYLKTITHNDVRIAFYCGKQGRLEKTLYNDMKYYYDKLIKLGYDENKVLLILREEETHNEAAWSKYFLIGLDFLLSK